MHNPVICRTYHGPVNDETHPAAPAAEHAPAAATPAAHTSLETLGLREQKKRQTRLAMHRAALELVLEEGLGGVTAEMIARRAGVSPRTFFNHWGTKEAAILGIRSGEPGLAAHNLRERMQGADPRLALRQVLREALGAVPMDPQLRELKKQAMTAAPQLHSISTGNLIAVQTELVDVLADALQGEDARERAGIMVQLGFAMTRSAFTISMARGIDLTAAFDQVVELYDGGRAAF